MATSCLAHRFFSYKRLKVDTAIHLHHQGVVAPVRFRST